MAAVIAALVIAPLAGWWLGGHLMANVSASDPHNLFWVSSGSRPLARGMYVTFPRGGERLIKRAGCVAGQSLERRGRRFLCDGVEIAVAKERGMNGQPLMVFPWPGGTVPPGAFFAVGHRFRRDRTGNVLDDSYDSRYFGIVREDEVDGYPTPLF